MNDVMRRHERDERHERERRGWHCVPTERNYHRRYGIKEFGLFGPDDSPELIRHTQAIRIVRDPSASVNFTLFNIK